MHYERHQAIWLHIDMHPSCDPSVFQRWAVQSAIELHVTLPVRIFERFITTTSVSLPTNAPTERLLGTIGSSRHQTKQGKTRVASVAHCS